MQNFLRVSVLIFFAAVCGSALAVNNITVSGNPSPLIIASATAGSEPVAVTDATTTYDIDVDTGSNERITGHLDSAMPANTALKVTLAAPTGATSLGQITLSTTSQDLINSIVNPTNETGLSITYEFSATAAAGVVASTNRTVTLTVTGS